MDYGFITDYRRTFDNIVSAGVKFLETNYTIDSLVIGLSGGIDSTVTCRLAREIVEKMDREITLRGYSMPAGPNTFEEVQRAHVIGESLCTHFRTMSLVTIAPYLEKFIMPLTNLDPKESKKLTRKDKIRRGNIFARMRMMLLYDRANKYDGIVLSTDNYTELLLGFWTLHGDVGDLGLIQNLWKTEVYGLANWMDKNQLAGNGMRECIEAMPTDGLGVTPCDLDQINPGWESETPEAPFYEHYCEVDKILIDCIKGTEFKGNLVANRHVESAFKRENPVNIPRHIITRGGK
jgi:NAD+ synthetase